MTYSLKLVLDMEKDMRNRWEACNKTSHGVNWKERISKDIAEAISGKSEQDAYKFLGPHLEKLYQKNQKEIDNKIKIGQKLIDQKINKACKILEKMTNKTIYKKDFIAYITTFPRGPYNYQKGYIRQYYNIDENDYIGKFLHELLHFQFIHYYKDKEPVSLLTNQEFEFLKESMTVILNHECKEFFRKPDTGYKIHQELRKKLDIFWSANKNFDEFVAYGCQEVKKLLSLKDNSECCE